MNAEVEKRIQQMLDGVEIEQANLYLMQYVQSDAAWEVCLSILTDSPHIQVKFFVATMLHTKVKRHWHNLTLPAKRHVKDVLVNVINSCLSNTKKVGDPMYGAQYRNVIDHILLPLCTACVYDVESLESYLPMAVAKMYLAVEDIQKSEIV
mgnify:CR=1 FL=1